MAESFWTIFTKEDTVICTFSYYPIEGKDITERQWQWSCNNSHVIVIFPSMVKTEDLSDVLQHLGWRPRI